MTSVRAAAVVVIAALFGAACSGQPSPIATSAPDDPGVGHIHGLGVDPADGSIYLAGHYGLFQVRSPQSAVRVADRIADHMGFTVVGPKTFLASGHPGAAEMSTGGAPHLGLIRTTDAGASWSPVSEAGVADFHAIQPAGSSLYAYDSQTSRVRRSTDGGRTWVQGAQMQVADLAGNAVQPDRVYATTPDGLQVSEDGGASFTVLPTAPLLSHVDAPTKNALVGVGADGQVHTSKDAGKTWQATGEISGQVTAFTAVDGQRLLAALAEGTVVESRNAGTDFSVAYRPAQS
ncbi:F510_1955 family glycosylhydrolase [Planomonospora parontospora]|uniref:F510_1955 family glycosylhydrolase n=1 Tax=Planomonospora parontospora TaxID=58119 RepID=UPI001670FF99|nr:exo-alpha-sialidase [Planomonospora parontospora]GGL59785.1 hypothetical protein GCM10014719_71340 [Planomonospora parontospora subsp. antibiotica]GII20352.1 hypothetical protein Ppa05_70780 [Planomonospora parontospora subsp. antibiotica]